MKRLLAIFPLTLILGCATADSPGTDEAPSDTRSRYRVEVGESPVGVIPEVTLRDAVRNKDLELSIEYPSRGTTFPLVIFSHGFGGSSQSYVSLTAYWASQGYVVIKPTHADTRSGSATPREFADETPARWRDRVRDVTFVLDSLDQLEQRYPELVGKIDRTRIGVGGHAYGAFTAMLLAGVTTFPGPVSYADPRVRAVVAMSPDGPREASGLTRESWSAVAVPVLYLTGTLDRGVEESETPEWRRQAFELATGPDQWLAVIEGARHASFTGRLDDVMQEELETRVRETTPPPTGGRRQPLPPTVLNERSPRALSGQIVRERDVFAAVRAVSLAFWDAYLRGEASGREALERGTGREGVVVTKK